MLGGMELRWVSIEKGIDLMEEKAEITNEFIQKTITSGKKYCVRLYKVVPNRNQPPDEAEKIQMEHLWYLMQLRAEGKLLIKNDDWKNQSAGETNYSLIYRMREK